MSTIRMDLRRRLPPPSRRVRPNCKRRTRGLNTLRQAASHTRGPPRGLRHPTSILRYSSPGPYTPKQRFDDFRTALRGIPLEFHFADSAIRTRHVLDRIRRGIIQTDYSLFDITDWNANVTLELGLAEGLNKDHYILFRPSGKKTQPPSDVQGIQRFQYRKLEGFSDDCLTYQVNEHLVKKLTHPRWVYAVPAARAPTRLSSSQCAYSPTSKTTSGLTGAISNTWLLARIFARRH